MVYGSKRGLSAIVATLIVVLLAIVAFGIISGFIQDVVTGKTQEAELASSDTRLNVQKASVEGNMSSVSVRREGSDSLEFVGARAVFDSGDGRAVVSSNFSIGKQELGTFSIPLCSEEFSDVDFSSEDLSATVYPIVMYEGERTMLDGNPSSVDFVEVDGPELVENCNKSESSESGSGSGTGDGSSDGFSGDDSGDSDTGSGDSGSGTGDESSDGDSGDNSDSRSGNDVSSDGSEDDSGSEDEGGICVDKDEDNYINKSSSSAFICNSFAGYDGNDCNDSNPDVHEGHQEICGDNVDNDCDGQVDEGCENLGAVPGKDSEEGSSGGEVIGNDFEVSKERIRAVFEQGGKQQKEKSLTFTRRSSQSFEVTIEIEGSVSNYVDVENSILLDSKEEELIISMTKPSSSGPASGKLTAYSDESSKEVELSLFSY